jgi:hypothetical protein
VFEVITAVVMKSCEGFRLVAPFRIPCSTLVARPGKAAIKYVYFSLLGYNAMYSIENHPTFQRNKQVASTFRVEK